LAFSKGARRKETTMRYLNRWSLSCIWVAAMIVAWFNLVPSVLSPSTWIVATLAGPVLLIGAGTFWDTGRPTPSFRQSQAKADAANALAGRRR
jgi:preprotein translocase subunit SecY